MAKKTKLIVYVDKDQMDKPSELFDAAFAHCVKKGLDMKKRHDFINRYTKAVYDEDKLKVINEWVMVRDVATFPFRKDEPNQTQEGEAGEDTRVEGGVSVDDQPDGEPEQGAASDGGDTLDGQDDAGE